MPRVGASHLGRRLAPLGRTALLCHRSPLASLSLAALFLVQRFALTPPPLRYASLLSLTEGKFKDISAAYARLSRETDDDDADAEDFDDDDDSTYANDPFQVFAAFMQAFGGIPGFSPHARGGMRGGGMSFDFGAALGGMGRPPVGKRGFQPRKKKKVGVKKKGPRASDGDSADDFVWDTIGSDSETYENGGYVEEEASSEDDDDSMPDLVGADDDDAPPPLLRGKGGVAASSSKAKAAAASAHAEAVANRFAAELEAEEDSQAAKVKGKGNPVKRK